MNELEQARKTEINNKQRVAAEAKANVRETNAHATGGDATDSRKSNITRQSEVDSETVNSSFDDSGLLNDSTLRKWQLT